MSKVKTVLAGNGDESRKRCWGCEDDTAAEDNDMSETIGQKQGLLKYKGARVLKKQLLRDEGVQ